MPEPETIDRAVYILECQLYEVSQQGNWYNLTNLEDGTSVPLTEDQLVAKAIAVASRIVADLEGETP